MGVTIRLDDTPVKHGGPAVVLAKRPYQITSAAARASADLGLALDDVIEMARLGAPVTDARANLRFDDVLLFVEGDVIYGVFRRGVDTPRGQRDRKPRSFETRHRAPKKAEQLPAGMVDVECPVCIDDESPGCAECRSTGRIRRTEGEYRQLLQQLGMDWNRIQ